MMAAGYSMDLYCDVKDDTYGHWRAWTYTGETFRECASQARRAGWKSNSAQFREGPHTCPSCALAGKRAKEPV